jgi:hypothetical protein
MFLAYPGKMWGQWDTYLSAVYLDKDWTDVMDNDVQHALKLAAALLSEPVTRGIPLKRIDTHSLCSGGVNTLALAEYSNRQTQTIGWCHGVTFKEYVHKQLSNFSTGMSSSMKKSFRFMWRGVS